MDNWVNYPIFYYGSIKGLLEMKKLKDVVWRLPIFFIMWLINVLIKLPTAISGFFIIPILYLYRHKNFDQVPNIFLPWHNPEDWKGELHGTEHSLPRWWINEPIEDIKITLFGKEFILRKAREHRGFGFWSFYKYHAIRNPANGLRNFDFIDLDLEQDKIHYWTPRYLRYYEPWHVKKLENPPKTFGYICWQGWMAGIKIVHIWNEIRHFVFKFGWRVEPRDAEEGFSKTSQRWEDGAGFASKFLPYRES